jgi:hypothetical protein
LFLLSFFGQKLFLALRGAPASVWLAVSAGIASVLLATWLARWHRQRAL